MQAVEYVYASTLCVDSDPRSEQPADVQLALKPHQRTALRKMISAETSNFLSYRIDTTDYKVSNLTFGVLADKAGYGKTLTILALIASNRLFGMPTEAVIANKLEWMGQSVTVIEGKPEGRRDDYVTSTLVVVPHGPVFKQWQDQIEAHTNLKCLFIGNATGLRPIPTTWDSARDYFSTFDLVLVSGTFYSNMLARVVGIDYQRWSRVVIDEAHSINTKKKMAELSTKFVWFVTATPQDLRWPNSSGYIRTSWNTLACKDFVRSLLTIQNHEDYVRQSFELPEPEVKRYLCKDVYNLNAISGFASRQVLSMLNANDIDGAIEALRGNEGDNIIDLLAADVNKDIQNIQIEIEGVNRQILPDRERRAKLERLTAALQGSEERYRNITERLSNLENKECSVCFDTLEDPVSLKCTHVFCGTCIMHWVKRNRLSSTCPVCKARIDLADVIRLQATTPTDKVPTPTLTKDEVLLELIKDKPAGKFIIFSQFEGSFPKLQQGLNAASIASKVLKGTPATQNKCVEDFRRGTLRVLMLNSQYSGSGIDIHFASDVVLYQSFTEAVEAQVIARAQRVGRKNQLVVHHLSHKNELLKIGIKPTLQAVADGLIIAGVQSSLGAADPVGGAEGSAAAAESETT